MEIRRLEYFLDLVETRNYSETAERMFTTQSNVSKQILALEKELGMRLVDRSHRKIGLTEAGELILPYARKLVKTEKEMEQALHAMSQQMEQVLQIHAIPVIAQYHVTELLARFGRLHPEICVEVRELERTVLEQDLLQERCDVIYSRERVKQRNEAISPAGDCGGESDSGRLPGESERCERIVADRDRFVAVLPAGHPLCGRVRLSDLREEAFILLDEKTGLLSCVQELCREAGFEPRIVYKGVRIDTILGMVAAGMGISILMEKTIPQDFSGSLIKLPLDKTVETELVFVRKKERKEKLSQTVQIFWDFLQKEFSNSTLE